MQKWMWMVLLVCTAIAVLVVVEQRRMEGLEEWCRAHGFRRLDSFVPSEQLPMPALAAHLAGREIVHLRWGSAIEGGIGDGKVRLAEVLFVPTGRKTTVWFTVAVWPVPQLAERRVKEAWAAEGNFVVRDGYAGWMIEGLLSAERAGQVLGQIEGVRSGLE